MNGPIWNKMAQEYEVWLDNEFITWASSEPIAQKIYREALHQKCEYLKHQSPWEWSTLATSQVEEVIEALDKAYLDTEPLQPFKIENGLNIVCSYCEQQAKKEGRQLAYEPKEASHGVCPEHFNEQMGLLERWIEAQQTIKVP